MPEDPWQMKNLVGIPQYRELEEKLEKQLQALLEKRGDKFLNGEYYMNLWGYPMDKNGTVPYTN